KLSYATAQSAVVNAEASLQTAKDAMEDTQVRAPNTGTVLELDAVLGTVISSPTRDVGGGTVILKMANLDTVQVDALVVEIHVGNRQNVLAVPNAALRTPRDVASAAQVLGLDLQTVQQQLAQAEAPRPVARDTADAGKLHAAEATKPGAPATFTTPSGRTVTLAPGVTPEQVEAAIAKRMSGAELTPAEQALLAQLRSQFQSSSGGGVGGRQGRTANGGGGA